MLRTRRALPGPVNRPLITAGNSVSTSNTTGNFTYLLLLYEHLPVLAFYLTRYLSIKAPSPDSRSGPAQAPDR